MNALKKRRHIKSPVTQVISHIKGLSTTPSQRRNGPSLVKMRKASFPFKIVASVVTMLIITMMIITMINLGTVNVSNSDILLNIQNEQPQEDPQHYLTYDQLWNDQQPTVVNANTNANADATFNGNENMFDQHYQNIPPEDKWLISRRGTNTSTTTMTTTTTNSNTNGIPNIIHKVYIETSGNFQPIDQMKQNKLMEAHESWHTHNPTYDIRYYNLKLCRLYLHQYFHPIFLQAFDCITAYAGKADLFRLAVTYKEGGWYSDWKQLCLQQNLLDTLGSMGTSRGVFFNKRVNFYAVYDHGSKNTFKDKCIINGFFGTEPNNPIIAKTIQIVLSNIQHEHYGASSLYSTGPCVLGQAYKAYRFDQDHPPTTSTITATKEERFKFGYFKRGYVCSKKYWKSYRGTFWTKLAYVKHKYDGGGTNQYWENGNDYNVLFRNKTYYCANAKSLYDGANQTNLMDVTFD